jgi:integrase
MPKLTELQLKALQADSAGKSIYDDGNLRGTVRVGKAGNVSVLFRWRYLWDGNKKAFTCGTWPNLSLATIRKERDKARQVLEEGHDPGLKRKAQKLETKAAQMAGMAMLEEQLARSTVQELFNRWLTLELSQRKESSRAELVRAFKKDVLPVIGHLPAEDVTRAHFMTVLDNMLARGARRLANRTLSEMRQMFGFGYTRDLVKIDPTHRIKKTDVGGRDKERERNLTEDEIRELSLRLPSANLYRPTECAIWIMLSTGCRVGDLMKATWKEIDFESRSWTFSPEKDQSHITRTHTVFLSDFSVEWLCRLREVTGSSPWLFPNRDATSFVCKKSVTKQIGDRQSYAADKKKKLSHRVSNDHLNLPGGRWTPHDLRRTCSTFMVNLGIPESVADKAIYHLDSNRTRRIYIRADQITALKNAWRLLGERLALLTRPDAQEKVIIGSFGKALPSV